MLKIQIKKISFNEHQAISPRKSKKYFCFQNEQGYFKFLRSAFNEIHAKQFLENTITLDSGFLEDTEWLIALFYNYYKNVIGKEWSDTVNLFLKTGKITESNIVLYTNARKHFNQDNGIFEGTGSDLLWFLLSQLRMKNTHLKMCLNCQNLYLQYSHEKLYCSRQCQIYYSQKVQKSFRYFVEKTKRKTNFSFI